MNQKGQATTEYILLLVVVVGMFLGGLYQFNMAFKAWATTYFGAYLECLLETGELPSFGAQSSGQCSQAFQSFSWAKGRPPKKGSNSSDGSSANNPGAAATSNNSKGNGNLTMAPGNGDGMSLTAGSGMFLANPPGSGKGKHSSDQNQTGGDAIANLQGDQGARIIRIPLRSQGIYGYSSAYDQNKKKTKILVHTSTLKKGRSANSNGALIKANRTTASVAHHHKSSGFTIGNLLRYLIIGIIIVAIVIFIGGQILQVSKSME